jgi:outer membrane protein
MKHVAIAPVLALVLASPAIASADPPATYGTGGTSTAGTPSDASISEDQPADSGFSFGLRIGYGIPLGDAAEGSSLSDSISGSLPFILDAGYRGLGIRNLYLGLFGTWGPAFLGDRSCPSTAGVSCSGSILRFGANARWHFMPLEKLDPYVGLGFGYEIVNFSAEAAGRSVDFSFKGFEFLELQAGLDYKVVPRLRVGPFANFALGQYSSGDFAIPNAAGGTTQFSGDIDKTALHQWLILGIRGQFDL